MAPRLWTETIATHRREVEQAILDAAGELVVEHGLLAVSMSAVAQRADIGRATLYKYFPDAEHILTAWHHRQVSHHLTTLTATAEGPGDAAERLRAVLRAYAEICAQRSHHRGDIAAALHETPQVATHMQLLHDLLAGLLRNAAAEGQIRTDPPVQHLAEFCVAALTAAARSDPETVVDLVWAALALPPA